jgi:kinesin family member 5
VLEGSTTDPGIIPRALNELFALRRRLGLAMSCCMFEVCGDKIVDLITPSALEAADIRTDFVRTSSLERQDVQEVLLYHRHHTFTLLHHAMRQRKQRHVTDGTERGHFVTVVRVERPNQSKRGLLYLVDLCGMADVSEATEKAASFKEGLSANSDVHHFERMVMSRASGEGFIPSKSCLLTRVLVDACGGNSKTALLVFISPRQEDKKVTMHAVQFAQSARSIVSHVKPNAIVPHDALKEVFLPMSLPSSPSRRSVLDDSGSVAVGKDDDHPRVSQWLSLKPYGSCCCAVVLVRSWFVIIGSLTQVCK